ncbi:MAG: helix-turn-helix transcriptional regulator [Acidobacteriota bacterium]
MRNDPTQHLPLHPLGFRVLMVLSQGPSFGTEIVRRIEEEESTLRIYPANLFRRIRDLLADDLLEECRGPKGCDPRRSYVRLTASGEAVLRAEARRLQQIVKDARGLDLLEDV